MMDKQSIAMGIKFQRRVGREEGLKEGLEKGLEKGRHEIARAMLLDGQSPSLVSKYTGLSEVELNGLSD